MLLAADHQPYGKGKQEKKTAEARRMSPQQHQCNRGNQVYRRRGGQHLKFCKPRSDFRHQDQVPEDDRGMS